MKIYNGYNRLARDYTLLVDEYEHTMAYGFLRFLKYLGRLHDYE